MALLIKNARVFSPDDIGINDLLIVNDRIVAIGKDLCVSLPDLQVLDATGLTLTPGFIDQHVHVIGGGGEGGPKTRVPELMLSELIACGTTAVVGVNGTDNASRSVTNLLGKIRGLSAEGVSTWMYTSNYTFPPTTLTGTVRDDIYFIPECLGVKIAMGDHRSSFVTDQEVLRLLTQIRVGAMVAGKLGVLHVHLGDLPGPFDMYLDFVKRGFPIQHIRPTHSARHPAVFEGAIRFGRAGGIVDITTAGGSCVGTAADAVVEAIAQGVSPDLLTMSTDGHGSVPRFNDKGVMVGLGVGRVDCNLTEIRRLIGELGVSVTQAISLVTRNVARGLQLGNVGEIAEGKNADLVLFDENMNPVHVFAKGQCMMRSGEIIVKGTFEE